RPIAGATRAGAEVRFSTDAPRVVFDGFPRPGHRGYFEQGSVRIQTEAGGRSRHRADARQAFSTVRHKLSWDTLDALYFVGYALWNYVSTPFMLTRPGFGLRESRADSPPSSRPSGPQPWPARWHARYRPLRRRIRRRTSSQPELQQVSEPGRSTSPLPPPPVRRTRAGRRWTRLPRRGSGHRGPRTSSPARSTAVPGPARPAAMPGRPLGLPAPAARSPRCPVRP